MSSDERETLRVECRDCGDTHEMYERDYSGSVTTCPECNGEAWLPNRSS